MYFDEAADRYGTKIIFLFRVFIVAVDVIIIFILIRDIKIRGADPAAAPKRTHRVHAYI